MAVPTIGNVTYNNQNPNGTSITISGHSQNSGSDRLLVVTVTAMNTANITSMTFGGVGLTKIHGTNRNGIGQRMEMWYLSNPNSGSGNIVINYNPGQFNPIGFCARSFTNSGGIGNFILNGASSTPRNANITVSDDSLIMMTSCAYNVIPSTNGQQIPTGTNRTFTAQNTYRQVANGAISQSSGHSAGSIPLRAVATSGSISLDAVEILGLSSSPTTDDADFFMILE